MSLHSTDASERGTSTATTGPVGDDSLPAPETFAVVADETRQRILGALHAASDSSLSFIVLQRRASVDGSTRFNYHLQVLLGGFVRESADGYDLTARGAAFVDAVSAAPSVDPDATSTRSALD
jgi:hypothetical protein